MKPAPLAYARASDLGHALALWREAGPDARLIAGGQSLVAGLNLRLADVPALIDISRIESLCGLGCEGGTLRIGALTTHAEIGRSEPVARHAPLLTEAAPLIAHPAIRTRGTLGGSLAYADPAAEWPACMLALDAVIVVQSEAGERRIPAADFFLGLFETALQPFEILVAVEIPVIAAGRRQAIRELARRSGDYAMAGLAAAGTPSDGGLRDVKLAYFGLGSTAILASGAMRILDQGGDLEDACAALDDDLDPADDLQASATMKRHLAKVLLRRVVAALSPVTSTA